jgi:hypothetical protein
MRWLLIAAPVLLVASGALAAPAAAQRPAGRTRSKAAVDSGVRAVYQRFLDGLRRRDTTAYRDLLTPNYVHVWGDSATVTMGRSARLQWDLAHDDGIRTFDVLKCDVQPYGGTAVGPCWFRQTGVSEGKGYDFVGVSLTTFVRGADGRWRIAATRPSAARAAPR